MRRIVFFLALLGIVGFGVFGAQTTEPKSGGTLTIAIPKDPLGFDPHQMHALSSYQIAAQLFNGLTRINREGTVVPDLAESWEVSEDGLTWTFRLRHGIVFHNGRAVTAEDVKYSIERIKDPATNSTWRSDYEAVETVEVVDPYTVQIKLSRPFAPLLEVLTWKRGAIVPKEVVEQYGDLNAHPVGTGPFIFEEYIEGQRIVLVKNPNYFRPGLPYLDRVVFKIVPEGTSRVVELLAGSADVIVDVPLEQISSLKAQDIVVDVQPSSWVTYIGLNLGLGGHPQGPWSDVRVRKAIAMALDKEAIAKAATLGYGFAIDSTVPLGSAYKMHVPRYERNLDQAKHLLAQAGYPNGFKAEGIILAGYPDFQLAGETIYSQLQEIGVELVPVVLEHGTYVQRRAEGDMFYWMTASVEGFDPYFRTNIYFLCDGSFNKNHYCNPEVDELLTAAMGTTSKTIREALYNEALYKILYEDVAWIPLYSTPVTSAARPYVENFFYGAESIPELTETWLNK